MADRATLVKREAGAYDSSNEREHSRLTSVFRSWDTDDATSETTAKPTRRLSIVLTILLLVVVAGLASLATWFIEGQFHSTPAIPPEFSSLMELEECKVDGIQSDEFIERMEGMKNLIRRGIPEDEQIIYAYIAEPGASLVYFLNLRLRQNERPLLLLLSYFPHAKVFCPALEERLIEAQLNETFGDGIVPIMTYQDHEDPYEKAVEILNPHEIEETHFFLDPVIRTFVHNGIAEEMPDSQTTFDIAVEQLNELRGIKSQAEINLLRCANVATKKAFEAVEKLIVVGMSEIEVTLLLEQALAAANLIDTDVTVLFGERSSSTYFIPPSERALRNSELIYFALHTAHRSGYRADLSRTIVPSAEGAKMSKPKCKIWRIVKKAQQLAFDKIRHGQSLGAVESAARLHLASNNLTGDFIQRIGHGIGLDRHEEPYLTMNGKDKLKANMVLCVEVAVYREDYGIVIGDVGTVTQNGFEVFGDIAQDPVCQDGEDDGDDGDDGDATD